MQRLKRYYASYRQRRAATKKIRRRIRRIALAVFLLWYLFCLPGQLFNDSNSTVLLDRKGELLGAKIADDGQWRFPPSETVPDKVAKCIVTFEDRNFYTHIGISLKGITRALIQNSQQGKVVSGGSTITMQLARLMRKNPPRTYSEKVIEMILATRIETDYSKAEILAMYASHAPFGNNVVGLDAASWRYFGRSAKKLSWAESATLAVLPNAPGLIYPGKNHSRLLKKRNRLLKQLYTDGTIDATTYELSLSEPLPDKPLPLPRLAPHLLQKCMKEGRKGTTIHSTLDRNLQEKALRQLAEHHRNLSANSIMNGAIIITDVNTGQILAYVGNTTTTDEEYAGYVDCAVAPRSTGSILKPLLYAKCLEEGQITPTMLITDVPSQFGGFSPKNYTGLFDGAVPANQALSRSLNIPMVHLLKGYGTAKFKDDLTRYGLSTVRRSAKHYGLSLILGGAEAKLTDLNSIYTQMAMELKSGRATELSFVDPEAESKQLTGKPLTNRAAIYSTFAAMIEVNRPDENNQWRVFNSAQPIAWKTGTSFGFRDAWAIGITPDYVISVWVGNADGEGRPGLTGVKAAAPLLFDLFRQVPASKKWFPKPVNEMTTVKICRESGFRATELCEHADPMTIPQSCEKAPSCPFHQLIHLDHTGLFRVDSDCEPVYSMQHKVWFVLPPLVERYYKGSHPNYVTLPAFKPECLAKLSDHSLQLMYPRPGAQIYIPIEIGGNPGRMILEATHKNPSTTIYWHLDDLFIGQTREIHQLSVNPPAGKHRITLVDENGISMTADFEVLAKG